MIGRRVLGIPLHRRAIRRRFLVGYWLAVLAALTALSRFPVPPDVSHWTAFLPLLLTLGFASNLPLLLGGFSLGGAVGFYEGRAFRLKDAAAVRLARKPEKAELVRRFLKAAGPADEFEARLRDTAHHRAHRWMFWMIYCGAIAFLLVSAADMALLPRFGLVLLELLLVAQMSLPQSCILWTMPDVEPVPDGDGSEGWAAHMRKEQPR